MQRPTAILATAKINQFKFVIGFSAEELGAVLVAGETAGADAGAVAPTEVEEGAYAGFTSFTASA